MHIVLVSFEFPPLNAVGGIGTYMYHLCRILNDANNRVTVFSANPNAEIVEVKEYEYCINYLLPSKTNEGFRKDVLPVFNTFLEKNKVDVIESPEVGACALLIKENNPHIPLVVKMHTPGVLITKVNNTYVPLKTKLRFVAGALLRGRIDRGYWSKQDKNRNNDEEYIICKKADFLISPSRALKDWASSYWGFDSTKIGVVKNPFYVLPTVIPIIERESKTICFVGKLTILKGIIVLAATIKKILNQYPDYRFILVGRDEPLSSQQYSAKAWIEQSLGVYAKNVQFLGVLNADEVRHIFETSDICVVPSLWENYPNVILEAMSAGCPVIAANRGGISEIIKHKKTGLLFNATSSNDFYKKIKSILDNKTFGFELATNAQRNMRHNKILEKEILEVYEQFHP